MTFVERVLGQATVAQYDPLLSESRDPASSDNEELLADVPAGNWADHMEFIDGLVKLESEPSKSTSQLQLELDARHNGDDVLDIGMEMHGLSEDEQDMLSSGPDAAAAAPVSQDDTSFFSLYRRAAEKLEVEWPLPPPAVHGIFPSL